MVNLTQVCYKYMPIFLRRPELRTNYFRKQAIFRLTATFYGSNRNCFKHAIRKWRKTMEYKEEYRGMRQKLLTDLYSQRLLAGLAEHEFKLEYFMFALAKSNIAINNQVLSELAIYEPRTFKSLVDLAKTVFHEYGSSESAKHFKPPGGVSTHGLFKE